MSSSTSFSPTTTSHSPTHSPTQGVTIPTTTVVGIGGGFVGFALTLLSFLLFVRFCRLALRARRDQIPIRQAWNDQGGFFGWIHGVGARDSDIDRMRRMEELERAGFWTGGGGWYSSEIARMRLWNEIRREGMKVTDDLGERPGMWEVALGEVNPSAGEKLNDEEKVFEAYYPLSIGPTQIPLKDTRTPPEPHLRLSLLIALPVADNRKPKSRLLEEDEFADLPDMVIGSTYFTPTTTVSHDEVARSHTRTTSLDKEDLKEEVEVAHLEYGSASGPKKATWVKKGDKWVIEGLEDCMSTSTGT